MKLPKEIDLIINPYLYHEKLTQLNNDYAQTFQKYWNDNRSYFYNYVGNTITAYFIAMYRRFDNSFINDFYNTSGGKMWVKDSHIYGASTRIMNIKNGNPVANLSKNY